MNFVELQNAVKRDPTSYKDDCMLHYRHFNNELQLFLLKPDAESPQFQAQVSFFSQIVSCYPSELAEFPRQVISVLEGHSSVLHPDVRLALVKALILLRNRNLLSPVTLLPKLFQLLGCHDKKVRQTIYSHVVSDVKKVNQGKKDDKLNRSLQSFMYTMMSHPEPLARLVSLRIIIHLYRSRIWEDAKTVNVISTGLLSVDSKTLVTALQFFLTPPSLIKSQSHDCDHNPNSEHIDVAQQTKIRAKQLLAKYNHSKSKMRKGKKSRLDKALHLMAKAQKMSEIQELGNFTAIQLLNDAQGLAEKLLVRLKASQEVFTIRMMMMNLISRLISAHKLIVVNFYPFIQRYLNPTQKNVTYIAAVVCQASHSLVPPDVMLPVIRTIADAFVTDRSSNETIILGLNSIREITARCPLAMDRELLSDLVQYKGYKCKGVASAARSLVSLFRQLNPAMLPRKLWGRDGYIGRSRELLAYGEEHPADGVDGIELLEQYELARTQPDFVDEPMEKLRESDSDGEWVNVVHSDEEVGSDGEYHHKEQSSWARKKQQHPKRVPSNPKHINDRLSQVQKEKEMRKENPPSDKDEDLSDFDNWDGWEEGSDTDNEDQHQSSLDEEPLNKDQPQSSEENHTGTTPTTPTPTSTSSTSPTSETGPSTALDFVSEDERIKLQEEAKKKGEEEEREKKQLRLDVLKILTPQDFERIEYLKLKKQIDGDHPKSKLLSTPTKRGTKRKATSQDPTLTELQEQQQQLEKKQGKTARFVHSSSVNMDGEGIDFSILQHGLKKQKIDQAEAEKEKERPKFTPRKKKRKERDEISRTNREKEKAKPFALTKSSKRRTKIQNLSMQQNLLRRQKSIRKEKTRHH